jgi:hypothetical protein
VVAPEGFATLTDISRTLGISLATLYNYKSRGKLPPPQGKFFEIEAVRALGIVPRRSRSEISETDKAAPMAPEESPTEPPLRKEIRLEMIRAAKAAAREIVAKAADYARKIGDHELRADLLDDFICIDECLKVTFEK